MKQFRGLGAYGVILGGQFASILGSSMTAFALSLWAWEVTGRATALALTASLYMIPYYLIAPLVGALIDRWDKRRALIVTDVVSAAATLVVLVLFLIGRLEVWHLFVRSVVAGLAGNFQGRVLSSSIPLLVGREHFGRVAGLGRLSNAGTGLIAPVLAASLYGSIGLTGIILIDAATFAIAVGSLLRVRIPALPDAAPVLKAGFGKFVADVREGFAYIVRSAPSLLAVCMLVGWINIAMCAAMITIQRPMILARSGSDALALGQVSSAMAAGAALGGLLLAVWGGARRRLRGWFVFCSMSALAMLSFALSRGTALWAISGLFYSGGISLSAMHVEAMIVAKTPPRLLGRIQGCRDLISRLPGALVQLSMGPLADYVFEPAMNSDTWLVGVFGRIVGRGPGAGMATMILIGSVLAILGILVALSLPRIRNADRLLEDQV